MTSRHGGWAETLRAAFPHTVPVMTGYLVLGLAYGVLMQTKGYGPLWTFLMSAIAYGGSMQYAAITLLTTAFDPLQAFLLSLIVNARHLFYGVAMLQKYSGTGAYRPFLIYTLSDETFSVAVSVEPPPALDKGRFYFCISALDHFYWVLGSVAGGVLGTAITFNTAGLDFALTALFVVLFIDQLSDPARRVSGAVGIGCALLSLLLFGADRLIIPTMAMIVTALLCGRKKLCT